ncbi:hypothetical protein LCGC14_1900080, partial [marine sediment metagenome]
MAINKIAKNILRQRYCASNEQPN